MRYIVVDLEATCWANVRDRDRMEIIEIGAVELLSASEPYCREFAQFVRPVAEPTLSDFCQQLTTIRQTQIDRAKSFVDVFPAFLNWIGSDPFALCSWGAYDQSQFRVDCERHQLPWPESFDTHINLKKEFAKVYQIKPKGMKEVMAHVGLQLIGTHHRGIDDARNISQLANLVLPVLESTNHNYLSTESS